MQRNRINSKGQNIFIGIDVHLHSWSVTAITSGGYKRQTSHRADAEELCAYLKKNFPGGNYHAVYESGFCGYSCCYELRALGIDCIITHAADVPSTQKSRLSKTDSNDSMRLATSLKNGELTSIYIPPMEVLGDRDILRYRTIVQKGMSRTRSRIKHLLHTNGVSYPDEFCERYKHWTRRFVSWLTDEVRLLSGKRMELDFLLEDLEHQRRLLLKATGKVRELSRTARYAADYANLISIPGVGLITAMTILTEVSDIQRFSSQKKFMSYVGLIPVMKDSGDTIRQNEITPRGNQRIRRMLIESAWSAVRYDASMAAGFGTYCRRMKKNRAIVRIARILAGRAYHILKTGTKYAPEPFTGKNEDVQQ